MHILIVFIVIFIIAVAIRKLWVGFHRAVGIELGSPKYISIEDQIETQITTSQYINLGVKPEQIILFPDLVKKQLSRIHEKAVIYFDWHQSEQKFSPIKSEDHFLLIKLLNDHLPTILVDYYFLLKNQKYNLEVNANRSNNHLIVLIELLNDIENRLDNLLQCMEELHSQNLAVMKRYLKSRT